MSPIPRMDRVMRELYFSESPKKEECRDLEDVDDYGAPCACQATTNVSRER